MLDHGHDLHADGGAFGDGHDLHAGYLWLAPGAGVRGENLGRVRLITRRRLFLHPWLVALEQWRLLRRESGEESVVEELKVRS